MNRRIALFAMLFAVLTFFSSCSDNSDSILNTINRGNVRGKVIGGLFNVGAPNVKICIDDKITYTDNYGLFVVNDISFPYDIYISSDTLGFKSGCVYRNVNQSECLFNYSYSDLTNITAHINISNSNITKSFFTDGKNINSISTGSSISIILPDNNPVIGKVYVIKCEYDSSTVISYSKFGFIENVIVNPYSNINLTFTDSMLSYNPPEALVTGRFFNVPAHNNWYSTYFWISASPRLHTYFSHTIPICNIDYNNFSFLIPSSLPVNYYPAIHISFMDTIYNGGFIYMNYIVPKNGVSNLNIFIPAFTQVTSPPANTFIDSNTLFTYYEDYSPQIYCVTIRDSTKTINIYSKEKNINLQKLWKLGFGQLIPGSKISFSVNAFGTYNSIDDFVNPDFQNLGTYEAGSPTLNYFVRQ